MEFIWCWQLLLTGHEVIHGEYMSSNILLEKSDFTFVSRCQLQIASLLGMGHPVSSPCSQF